MTVERKVFDAHLKVFTGEGRGTAVLGRLGVRDKDGDVLVPGLLGGEQQVPLIQAHDWQVPAFGRAVVRERDGEMVADFVLNLETPRGKEWASVLAFDLAHGPIQQWSWGFSVLPNGSEIGTHEDERVRLLRRIKLHEVSPVVVGASVGSRTLSLKDGDEVAGVVREYERLSGLKLPDLTPPTAGAHVFRYKFSRVPADDPRWQAACAGLKVAVAELRSTEPYLYFFTEALPGDEVSFISPHPLVGASHIPAHPNVVAVHEKLSPAAVLETIAHEVCHHARPGLSEAKVAEFGREIARTGDLPTLIPVPVFLSPDEARAMRRSREAPVHYDPFSNTEYMLTLRVVPTRSPQPKARGETAPADRLSPLSGRPMPQ